MKSNKEHKGRRTMMLEKEIKISNLKRVIFLKNRKINELNKKIKEKTQYIQDIHNFIGTKQLKKFKELKE